MYKFLIITLLSIGMPYFNIKAEETTLFDSGGQPAAYIYSDDLTIYTWSGKPVAYITFENENPVFMGLTANT
jgi:hypothetical protein